MKFSILFPQLRGWVDNLANVWPAYYVKPNFAVWEVFHIVTLVMLGGASILIGLRLNNVGVTEEKPSEVYKDMRPWLHAGIWGVVISGVLIGMANAERLYDSAAFLAKMLCLAGGIALVYGATRPVALSDGQVSKGAMFWAAVGTICWLLAVLVFLTGGLIPPGLFHLLTGAALIAAFVTRGRLRWLYVAGLGLIVAAMYVIGHIILNPEDLAKTDPANVTLGWIAAVWIFGCAGYQMLRSSRGDKANGPIARSLFVKALGYLTILIWVTAAAGGRWIAFA